jgi:hypothetical protein
MQFRTNGNVYDVTWQYDRVPSAKSKTEVIRTTCTISDVDETKKGKERFSTVCSASVTQDPHDQFSKSEGRRRSLTKALTKFGDWGRQERKLVWANYFAQADLHVVSQADYDRIFGETAHRIGI